MTTFIFILELLTLGTILTAIILLLAGEGSREHKLMEYFLCGSLVQNIGYVLELTAPSVEAAVTAVKMEYVGSIFIPVCYCWFLYDYCYGKPPRKLLGAIGTFNTAMLFLILTCDRQTLFYQNISWVVTQPGQGYLQLQYGVLFPLFLFGWIGLPYILSTRLLVKRIMDSANSKEALQYRMMLLVSLLPAAAFATYAFKLIRSFDPTPATLGLSLSLVAILLWSRRNYDFQHIAADVVLDGIADGVVALDNQMRLVRCNRAAKEIFPSLANCSPGEYPDAAAAFIENILDEGMAKAMKLNDRYYESHARQITDENGKCQGYVILIVDFTDVRNYIDEMIHFRQQAEQANIAKSEFLANMSHEIRTPMNAIIGLSDIIMEESQGRKICDYAKDVQSAAKNLLIIINDILDLSKVEAGRMELILTDYYIKTLVGEIVTMMEIAASQRGLKMLCEFDTSIPCAYCGDEGRIKQILINLLNNAVKFTTEGHVKLSVSGQPGEGEDDELLVFRVEDTGCGIREEDQEKIFEDFKQVDSKRNRTVEGTGLGLSITKHLVKLMNGHIGLESVYNVGSVFTVTIPQKIVDSRTLEQAPEPPKREVEQTDDFAVPGLKVLVVDDNAVNRKVARGFLSPYEMEITEASSGPEAISLVEDEKFDIIFMDHMMPGMDGIEAVEHIRSECGENGTSPVIIALTANAMQGVREKFLACGFQDFIAKPMERKPLSEAIRRWVPPERRAPRNSGASDKSKQLNPLDFVIEGIDQDVLAQRADSTEDYLALLELYCLEGKHKLELIRQLAEKEDLANYEVEVHGLKSASANIGAMVLSGMAKEQELAAHGGDLDSVRQNYGDLLEAYGLQLSCLNEFLDAKRTAAGQDASLAEIDHEQLVRELTQAQQHLEDFRSRECLEQIEGLFCYRLDEGVRQKLKQIEEQLKLFEDDAAEELLHNLLDELQSIHTDTDSECRPSGSSTADTGTKGE